ncbi:DUF6510 family protein [Leifsonia soli]|uniref:Phage FluMu protein Com n=1 Tax=Leifsonia soli TaxID=582665 RepID=A0A852T5G7_9MICO|nr:DUF6510 family protein [Leifsonia soli]NYD76092.1 phage FluMu protein Com [Leifsonia soli]
MSDNFLDGNVLAGPMSDVFEHDITTMIGECAHCRNVAAFAEAMVFGAPMGFVLRCRKCSEVLAVLVDQTPRRLLAMTGLRWIDITG